ncbi:NAD(P)-binding protein [Aspergillus sclerotioniger CBS 115572]|uniref:NAD(P)-binding protein n=1 Tax=Aspergillus sclerotioniger CBS 115572 TaxID=1450535 RepID=A0A317X6U2_9EURO|nr:NAD(P)-binding protein [Aspergillus sclerotioniger CBS 115572]PWY94346.1 NAD(P)-binding protein [Aspergillus sclerotioniger CBS 115572]
MDALRYYDQSHWAEMPHYFKYSLLGAGTTIGIADTPAIPLGSWVLVTGINGLVGSHVADQLLAHGYRVRGTVRDSQRCQWVRTLFHRKYGDEAFQLVQIEDQLRPGVSGIAHVATILEDPEDPNELFAAINKSDCNILASAAAESNVKRFVYTSSAQAATSISFDEPVDKPVTSESWNEFSIQRAQTRSLSDPKRYFHVYSASKVFGERGVWDWVERHKPGFVTNTVLPSVSFGASLDPEHQGHPSTSIWPAAIFKNEPESVHSYINSTTPIGGYCVGLEDVGLLHVASLSNPTVHNERLFVFGIPFLWPDFMAALRKLFPGRDFPDGFYGESKEVTLLDVESNRRCEELLKEMGKSGWSSLEEMLMANVSGLV